jgi:hypothetical protein
MPDPTGSDKTECEIEITPDMVEAGLVHLFRYHAEYGVDADDTVTRIFQAMLGAQPKHSASEEPPASSLALGDPSTHQPC